MWCIYGGNHLTVGNFENFYVAMRGTCSSLRKGLRPMTKRNARERFYGIFTVIDPQQSI